MSSENAWLLDFGKPLRAAVGMRELLQIIDASEIYEVPLTPAHSRHIMFWQKRMIPVMDLSLRLGAKATQSKMLALVGYQDHANQSVGIGAIVLAAQLASFRSSFLSGFRGPSAQPFGRSFC